MPIVRFIHASRSLDITSKMYTPTHISWEAAWYKQARRVIPAIPNLKDTDWQITNTTLTKGTIIFTLHNSIQDTCIVTIDRLGGRFGR